MNTDFNVIPMVVFLQKDTNNVEKFYFHQFVGICTTITVVTGAGITYGVNYGCDSEGRTIVGFNTSSLEPIYDATLPCYISHENIGPNDEKLVKLNKEDFDVLEFGTENMPVNNPIIGWAYNNSQNKFFDPNSPVEGYILNETTLEWEPDSEKTYDLHGDGKYYRYDPENKIWFLV